MLSIIQLCGWARRWGRSWTSCCGARVTGLCSRVLRTLEHCVDHAHRHRAPGGWSALGPRVGSPPWEAAWQGMLLFTWRICYLACSMFCKFSYSTFCLTNPMPWWLAYRRATSPCPVMLLYRPPQPSVVALVIYTLLVLSSRQIHQIFEAISELGNNIGRNWAIILFLIFNNMGYNRYFVLQKVTCAFCMLSCRSWWIIIRQLM